MQCIQNGEADPIVLNVCMVKCQLILKNRNRNSNEKAGILRQKRDGWEVCLYPYRTHTK